MSSQGDSLLVLYAVRNHEGKFFRAKGYQGYGETWVDDLKRARIYARPGPARAQVTFFATHYPSLGIPELVELHVGRVIAVQETERIQKNRQIKKVAERQREKKMAEESLRRAEENFKQAEKELAKARLVGVTSCH
jgi:hypothetical protein